ncbi:hypothetical protein P879_09568 [Paragonimus westermani]|uniref:Arginase n=1 Tax=Paragonimus westermani TaxID=34504 RepID=A0A8T0D678_9TREM|nr:hypothetical protein P879_09568 [Paragonimus westermani]
MNNVEIDLKNPVLARDSPLPLYPHVKLMGVPVKKGQPKDGTQFGPKLIRDTDIVQSLQSIGVKLEDLGDLLLEVDNDAEEPRVFGMINAFSFIDTTCKIAKRVEELLKADEVKRSKEYGSRPPPLILIGGDHSMATGSLLGHRRAEPDACVIWVDAHADLNTPLTSSSGNTHGMPVAFVMNELQEEIPYMKELESIDPCLNATDIVYIGLRDLDPHEVYDLRKNNIKHFTITDIDKMGIESVIQQAIQAVNPRLERPIHLSFDIDAMDPSVAPSTGTPVPGGLSMREGLRICEEIYATGKLSVMDLVELNPLLGTPADVQLTQNTAVSLLKACLGTRRCGHLPFKVHSLADEGIPSRADRNKLAK